MSDEKRYPPSAAKAWIDSVEAEFREDDERALEIAIDGFPAVLVRKCDEVLGAPSPPLFFEAADGTVVEIDPDDLRGPR